jgi:hypothetical protein
MAPRTVHPYDDTDVIDARAPRTNQAVIGSLALVAFAIDAEWLVALLALQLAVGLVFGRRFCLPCLLYFELIQRRFGEGRLEDARPPRFANMVGAGFLGTATIAFLAGAAALGWVLTLIVSALALLAASTGLCLGCAMYVWLARLRAVRNGRLDPGELGVPADDGGGVRLVEFSSPMCFDCQRWEAELERAGLDFVKVDVSKRPDLARSYGVRTTPLVLALKLPEGEVLEAFTGGEVDELEKLARIST